MSELLTKVSARYVRPTFVDVLVGDSVRVYTRVKEGDKERTQHFEGLVIRRHGGLGSSASFTVRRITSEVGVERTFALHSPFIEKITVQRAAKIRRARLYTMRGRRGKAARLTELPVKTKDRQVTHPWIAKFGIKVEERQPARPTGKEVPAAEKSAKETSAKDAAKAAEEKPAKQGASAPQPGKEKPDVKKQAGAAVDKPTKPTEPPEAPAPTPAQTTVGKLPDKKVQPPKPEVKKTTKTSAKK